MNQENKPLSEDEIMIRLAKAAQARGGKLSVTQGVIDTDISFAEVDAALNKLLDEKYIRLESHHIYKESRIYNFIEL